MSCLRCLSRAIGSAGSLVSPSTTTRENPSRDSFASSLRYSPLRPRTIGAHSWTRAPSPIAITASTICVTVCRRISFPQEGQWTRPMEANSSRR